MNPVGPEELSALLDGELSIERAAEVRRQVHADPELQREFANLSDLDSRVRATVASAAFVPLVSLPKRSSIPRWIVAIAAAIGLTLVRLAPKFLESASIGLAVNCLVLVLLLGFVVWLVRADDARRGFSFASDLNRSSPK